MRFLALIALCLLGVLLFSFPAAAQDEACVCPRHLDFVCGTDGITYPNPCELKCAVKNAKRRGRDLSLAKRGTC